MRSIASELVRFVNAAAFFTIASICPANSLASSQGSFNSTTQQNKNDGIAVNSYCESGGASSIINLENCSVANKIIVEKGCIRIVKDDDIETKHVYAKNIEEE